MIFDTLQIMMILNMTRNFEKDSKNRVVISAFRLCRLIFNKIDNKAIISPSVRRLVLNIKYLFWHRVREKKCLENLIYFSRFFIHATSGKDVKHTESIYFKSEVPRTLTYDHKEEHPKLVLKSDSQSSHCRISD